MGTSLSKWHFGFSVLVSAWCQAVKITEVPWSPIALSCWHFCLLHVASVPSRCPQRGDSSWLLSHHVPKTLLVPRLCAPREGPHLSGCHLHSFLANPFFFFEGGAQPHWGSARVTCLVASSSMSCYSSCPFFTRRQVWLKPLVKEGLLA